MPTTTVTITVEGPAEGAGTDEHLAVRTTAGSRTNGTGIAVADDQLNFELDEGLWVVDGLVIAWGGGSSDIRLSLLGGADWTGDCWFGGPPLTVSSTVPTDTHVDVVPLNANSGSSAGRGLISPLLPRTAIPFRGWANVVTPGVMSLGWGQNGAQATTVGIGSCLHARRAPT